MGAEEAHLKKMLDAGVIEESASDWVSSSVLIRKHDGSVQWCIGYRGLNKITVKYVPLCPWLLTVSIHRLEIFGSPDWMLILPTDRLTSNLKTNMKRHFTQDMS